MMQKIRFIGVSLALVSAFVILGVSLSTVNLVQSAGSKLDGQKELYFSGTVLPDHVAYPVLMAIDRVKLEAASPLERVYLQTEYANRRLDYVKALLEKEKFPLALSTLSKGQKYLLESSATVLHDDVPVALKRHVLKTIEFHIEEDKKMAPVFSDQERAMLDKLIEELVIVAEQIRSSIQ